MTTAGACAGVRSSLGPSATTVNSPSIGTPRPQSQERFDATKRANSFRQPRIQVPVFACQAGFQRRAKVG